MNDKVKAFFKGKGFYISLLVGVIAILGVGVISSNMLTKQNEDVPELVENEPEASLVEESQPDITVADQQMEETSQVEDIVPEEVAEETETEVAEEEPQIAPVISQSERIANLTFDEDKGLLWPITGDIILPYSMDRTIYFKTLAQYKCNPAMMIAGTEGMDVLCAYNGVITSIEENEETGTTLTMSIGNGYQLVYGNLEGIAWKVGDYVSEESFLGTLASPTKYYVEEGTNLYFEVLQDEECVDPLLILR